MAHPLQRMPIDGHAHHLRLPEQASWLRLLAQVENVSLSWKYVTVLQSQKYSLVGLADVDISSVRPWRGSLTAWSREAFALHEYYNNPVDSFIVQAKYSFKLEEARSVFHKLDKRAREVEVNGSDGIFQPSGVSFAALGDCVGTETKIHDAFAEPPRRARLCDVLGKFGLTCQQELDTVAACMLPQPVADLVMKGCWADLLWMSRWKWFQSPFSQSAMWSQFKIPPNLQEVSGQHEVLGTIEPLDLSYLEGFLNDLRRWRSAIVAACEDDEEASGQELLLNSHATWLRQLLVYFKPHFAKEIVELGPRLSNNKRYSDCQLVGMVLFAWHLRDSVAVKEAMPTAMEAIFPNFFAQTSIAMGQQALKQSKSLLRNAQLAVDMALMLVRRRRLEQLGTSARYGWADSSPIAKSDWLISKHQAVLASDCTVLWGSWKALVDTVQSPADASQQRQNHLKSLMSGVCIHTQPPQAMGLGLTALESKVAALLFSLFLEVGSQSALKDFLKTFVSFTTDMGTELGAASFLVEDMSKLLPEWLAEPLLEMDVDEGDGNLDNVAGVAEIRFMPNAIIIPGALHICSNLCKDVSSKLSHWEPFLQQLALFEGLLCMRDRRERFLSTCVPDTADERKLFTHFSGSLYEKRWGAVISFLRKLYPLLEALQKYWSSEKYMQNYQQRESAADNHDAEEGHARFAAADLSATLGSGMFHVYLAMVMSLFNVVENLSSWFEGCLCHDWELKKHRGKLARNSQKEIAQCGPYAFCPMKGKRAPELAAGCLQTTFDEIVQLRKRSLLESIRQHGLDSESERCVLSDFEAGRLYIQLGLQVKFDFWTKCPWRLAALAHPHEELARASARDTLETVSFLDVADPDLVHHPVTLRFLHPDGPLRCMVEAFASGDHMTDALCSEVAKLSFMPVVERSIEAKHSLISRRVQKNWRSGRIVSLTLRVPDIKAAIAADANFLQELTDAFALTRDPVKASHQLGIQEHPALVQACFDSKHKNQRTGILNRIVYRCDLESKYEAHGQARVDHEQRTKKRARLAEKQIAKAAPAAKPPARRKLTHEDRYADMLSHAIQDHFTKVVSSATSSRVYSLDLAPNEHGCGPSLKPLDAVLEGERVAGISHRRQLSQLTPDIASDALAQQMLSFEGHEVVHFQVVHVAPSNMRTVAVPLGAGRRLAKGEIAISVHALQDLGDGKRHISMQPTSQGATCVAILSDLSAGDLTILQETCTEFELGQLAYSIKDFVPQTCQSCCQAVTELVRAGAFPDSHVRYEVALENGQVPHPWDELEGAGLISVVMLEGRDAKSYALTPAAVQALEVVAELTKPKLVCEPRVDMPLQDCTCYELLRHLEAAGWTWQPLPDAPQKRRALSYSSGCDRNFYSAGLPHPLYMRCLLDVERLLDIGVESIPHWSPKPALVYAQLLQGRNIQVRAAPRLMLQADVDGGGELQAAVDGEGDGAGVLAPVLDAEAVEEVHNDPLEADQVEVVDGDLTPTSREQQIAELLELMESTDDDKPAPDAPEVAPLVEPPPRVGHAPARASGANDAQRGSVVDSAPAVSHLAEAPVALADANVVEAPRLAVPAPKRAARTRNLVEPGCITYWGCFRISMLVAKPDSRPYGALEAVCPFHRRSRVSQCKKYIAHKSDSQAEKDLDYKALLHWCAQARTVNRQRHHVGMSVLPRAALAELAMDVIEAQRIDEGPSDLPTPDDELDKAAGPEEHPPNSAGSVPAVTRRVRGKRAATDIEPAGSGAAASSDPPGPAEAKPAASAPQSSGSASSESSSSDSSSSASETSSGSSSSSSSNAS